jgi:hypothetical protein
MAPGIFTPAKSKPDNPHNEKYRCRNPQKMQRESRAEKDQDEKQCEYQHHRNNLPM